MTLIDPLDGYYDSIRDPNTGLPISDKILNRDFDIMRVPPEQLQIIKSKSNAIEAQSKASSNKYDFIFIDGNHSYAWVKSNFENYLPMLAESG